MITSHISPTLYVADYALLCKALLIKASVKYHVITLLSVTIGAVVALELNGDGVVAACRTIANEVFSGCKVTRMNT